MRAEDVTATLEMALDAAGLDKARVFHRPRLLSDNGSSYISDDQNGWTPTTWTMSAGFHITR
jgi:hypothetical protein